MASTPVGQATERVPSIIAAPVRVAHARLGPVGCRTVGDGPALPDHRVGGSMEDWEPTLVDGLAKQYRVVIFDNSGIGRTRAR